MVVAFVQVRMSSNRLPGKVLRPIDGKPMLWHLWWRLSQSETLDKIVIATSDLPSNDPIEDFCTQNNIACFRGSEDDVLDRIYQAAVKYKADTIVGITGDCPLVDPQSVDRVVREYQEFSPDLCAISPSFTYPDGFGTVVFSLDVLTQAYNEVTLKMDREHLTLFIHRNPDRFKIRYVEYESYHPFTDLHLSVDDEDDFKLVERIFKNLLPEKKLFHIEDVLNILRSHPEWVAEHPQTPINEGYFKSLLADKDLQKPIARQISLSRSRALLDRAIKRIPSCTQTFSKGYTQFVQGVSPVFIERGEGGFVYDVDGNRFIDYPLGLGAVVIGHCNPEVDEAVIEQVRKGASHSLPHRIEVEFAEKLCEVIPCAEMVRFGKNGSDVTAGAVRVARAITGRDKVLCCGYHGWQDWYIGTTLRNKGIPSAVRELTLPFPYNDMESLERLFDEHDNQIAAIVMEPVGTVAPDDGYLSQVQELAHRHGALLIFDEIVTGFRFALGGAQQYFGIMPDLACIGKGMGNGYPISAVVGRKDIMEEFDNSFFSFTFGGEAVSIVAAMTTLAIVERDNVISHMWILGRKLKDAYNYLARLYKLEEYTYCQGFPPKASVFFKDQLGDESLLYKSIFQQECVKHGVLFNGHQLNCLMRTDRDIEYTVAVYNEAFQVLQKAYNSGDPGSFLDGEMINPIFRRADY